MHALDASPHSEGTQPEDTRPILQRQELTGMSQRGPVIVKTVKEGDRLIHLIREVYGSYTLEHVEWIRASNPHIKDVRNIYPGQEIVFPKSDPLP